MDQNIGEVIAADTVQLEAECHRLYAAPDFGAFVRAASEELDVYAVVYHIATGCIDANRRTQALGLSPEEIARRLPHLDLVLRTTFAGRVVGFRQHGETYGYLPPQPARIHTFVHAAAPEEIRAVTASTTFLRILATAPDLPVEDLIAGALRAAERAWSDQPQARDQRVAWGKYLARLFRNDYDRFEAIMQRLGPIEIAAGMPWEEPLPLVTGERDPFVE
jgi:hypothetical protein